MDGLTDKAFARKGQNGLKKANNESINHTGPQDPRRAIRVNKQETEYETWHGLKRITPQEFDLQAAQNYKGFNSPMKNERRGQEVASIVQRAVRDCGILPAQNIPTDAALDQDQESQSSYSEPPKPSRNDTAIIDGSQTPIPNVNSAIEDVRKEATWERIPLTDPSVKFALIKRVCQLYGARVPDPAIASIRTPLDLVRTLMKEPNIPKLRDEIRQKGKWDDLSNLRWTAGKKQDVKDREIGSHKIIEEQLHRIRLMSPQQRAFVLGE